MLRRDIIAAPNTGPAGRLHNRPRRAKNRHRAVSALLDLGAPAPLPYTPIVGAGFIVPPLLGLVAVEAVAWSLWLCLLL